MSDFTDFGHFLFNLRQAKQQPKELKTLVFLRFFAKFADKKCSSYIPGKRIW